MQADVLLFNGRIVTLGKDDRTATALVITAGRIAALGSDEQMRSYAAQDVSAIDLKGAAVTPGLIDTHLHTVTAGRRMAAELDLSPASSIAELIEQVEDFAARRKPGEWIVGSGWLETSFKEDRTLDRSDLDRAAPHHPVILTHATGHLACANSLALQLSGISERTPDPPNGSIGRAGDGGSPSGILHEFSAMNLVFKFVPPPSIEEWKTAILQGGKALAREGVTATKETYDRREYHKIMKAYALLGDERRLHHRPTVLCSVETIGEIGEYEKALASRSNAAGDSSQPRPDPGGIKIYLDGSLVARTAWMHDPYQQGGCGFPAISTERFKQLASAADRRGFHVAVHAIGDQAIDTTLETFESLSGAVRPALVHALLPSENAFARLQDLDVSIETQPAFLHVLGPGYARALDRARLNRLLPLQRMMRANLALSFGSDWPTCPPSPRLGMWSACNRFSDHLAPESGVHEPEQRITVKEALHAYTINAARAIGKEAEIGSIEIGKFADLVVWDGDILSTPPEKLLHLRIRQTIVAGEAVFDASRIVND